MTNKANQIAGNLAALYDQPDKYEPKIWKCDLEKDADWKQHGCMCFGYTPKHTMCLYHCLCSARLHFEFLSVFYDHPTLWTDFTDKPQDLQKWILGVIRSYQYPYTNDATLYDSLKKGRDALAQLSHKYTVMASFIAARRPLDWKLV